MTVPRRSAKSPAKADRAAKADPEPRRRRRSRRKATGPVPAPGGGNAGDPAAELALMAELASKAAGNLADLADLAEAEAEDAAAASTGGARRIGVVVADHREPATTTVLDKLRHEVDDLVVVVHGGSTGGTRAEVEVWLAGQDDHCHLLVLGEDAGEWGTPAAHHLAFADLRRRMAAGELDPGDLVLTAGADGRHDLDVLDDLHRQVVEQDLDALLVRRDLSVLPVRAQLGHRLLSAWATLWAGGVRLHDVTSPYRLLRLGPLVHALDHHDGRRRTEAAEVAVVMSRLRYAVRNDIVVPVPADPSRRSLVDLAADLLAIPRAAIRVSSRRERPQPAPSLVPPFAVCVGLAMVPALLGRWLARAVARHRRR